MTFPAQSTITRCTYLDERPSFLTLLIVDLAVRPNVSFEAIRVEIDSVRTRTWRRIDGAGAAAIGFVEVLVDPFASSVVELLEHRYPTAPQVLRVGQSDPSANAFACGDHAGVRRVEPGRMVRQPDGSF